MIAVDIGGTNTRIFVFINDKLVDKFKMLTNKFDYKETLDKVVDIAKKYDCKFLGLAIPGPANYSEGIILNSPNLQGWRNINIKKYISDKHHFIDIFIFSDSNMMALSSHFEAKSSIDDITLFYTLSTGIGCGLIINNNIYKGFSNNSTEIARMPISKFEGKKNWLGKYSLEYFSGGNGLALRAKNNGLSMTNEELFKSYKSNDIVKKIIDQGIIALGRAIAAGINYLNPSKIIFDGAIARSQKWYIDKAIKFVMNNVPQSQKEVIEFIFSNQGDDGVINGIKLSMKGVL